MDKGLGLISKGGDSFYKKPIKIIDRDGFVFNLKSISSKRKAGFMDSLRYFQPMQQLTFELEQSSRLNLSELKSDILKHVKMKPKKWLSLGTIEMIEEWIFEKKSIADLIKMFK